MPEPNSHSPTATHVKTDLEGALSRFEHAWQQGKEPPLEDYLPTVVTARKAILVELIHADLEYRFRRGEPIRLESYLARYPELRSDRTAVVDLIASEFRLRKRREPQLCPDEYLRRFPEFREILSTQLNAVAAETPRVVVVSRTETDLPTVPGYEVLSLLGRGGMGVVYKARHLALSRTVALKMIQLGALASPEHRERFLGEARAAARLSHPNIVQIHEVGECRSAGGSPVPFFSLEFVEGGALDSRLNGAPRAAKQSARIVATLADAMSYAHGQGVVHRDLKPANVLVGPKWELKITDFGLAKMLDADQRQTQTGDVMGTPSYMAPEQATGQVKEMGPATDVYALGAILYELLTGRPPFRGPTALETLEMVRTAEPVPPRRLQPLCPRDLETITLECLHKEPGRRYPSAQALADDLRRFLDGKPITARPTAAWERGMKWVRRNPVVASLLGTIVAGVAVAFGVVLGLYREAESRRIQAETAEVAKGEALGAALAAKELEKSARNDAERLAAAETRAKLTAQEQQRRAELAKYAFQIREADRALHAFDVGAAVEMLDECRWDLQGWEYHHLRLLCERRMRSLPVGHLGASDLAATADGKLLVAACRNRVVAWTPATGTERILGKAVRFAMTRVAIAPAGGHGAWNAGPAAIHVCDLKTGKLLAEITAPGAALRHFTFSPDGMLIATVSDNGMSMRGVPNPGRVVLWKTTTGKEAQALPEQPGTVTRVAFSPDGKSLLTVATAAGSEAPTEVKLWDLAPVKERLTLPREWGWVHSAGFTPDGQGLILACVLPGAMTPGVKKCVVQERDAATGKLRREFGREALAISKTAFSPDGKLLAFTAQNAPVRVVDFATGATVATLRARKKDESYAPGLTFAGNTTLAVAYNDDPDVHLWGLDSSDADRMPLGEAKYPPPVLSGDGFTLAVPTPEGFIRIQKAGDGKVLATISTRAVPLALSDDGKILLTAPQRGGNRNAPTPVQTWDAETGKPLAVCEGTYYHAGTEATTAFSQDGATVAVILAVDQKTYAVWLWETGTGKLLRKIPLPTWQMYSLAFSPDGKHLASGCHGNSDQVPEARIWELATGNELHRLRGHTEAVMAVAFSPDGRTLATGGNDKLIKLWDVRTGEERLTLAGHLYGVHGLRFSPRGDRLFSWSATTPYNATRGELRVWDTTAGQHLYLVPAEQGWVSRLAVTPDGQSVVGIGMPEQEVRTWRAPSESRPKTVKGHTNTIFCVAFTPDGKSLLTAAADRTVKVWDLATGQERLTFRGQINVINHMTVSSDGKTVATVATRYDDPRPVVLWNPETGRETEKLEGTMQGVRHAAFSPDGRLLALTGYTIEKGKYVGLARLWDASSGKEVRPLATGLDIASCSTFAPDGNLIAVGGYLRVPGAGNGQVRVCNTSDGSVRLTLAGHTGPVAKVVFFPDGKRLVSVSDGEREPFTGEVLKPGELKTWDLETGKEVPPFRPDSVDLHISGDGKTVATLHRVDAGSEVRLWDLGTGKLLGKVSVNRAEVIPSLVALSPDGRRLAVSGYPHSGMTVGVYDLASLFPPGVP